MTLDYTVYLLQQTKKRLWPYANLTNIDEVTAEYYRMLVRGERDPKDKSGNTKASDSLRNKWYEHVHQGGIKTPSTDLLSQIAEPTLQPEIWPLLPIGAFYLHFTLTLSKPLITRDDETFYVIENPIAKDVVFRQPMVRSTSWKGLLRYAMRLQRKQDQAGQPDDKIVIRLFGTEKREAHDGNFKAGRLAFFATFFNAIDLEVINPHIRERKVGTQPIALECVPRNAQGRFHLLYTPFDLLTASKDRLVTEARADLEAVTESLQALMLDLGFSAKRTSGYGVIHDRNLDGHLWFKQNGEVSSYPFNTFAELKNVCWQIIGGQAND